MKRPRLKYPWVRVEWEDITSYNGWGDPDDNITTMKVYEEGWLIRKTRKHIVVSANCSVADNSFSSREVIPRGCVLHLEIVTPGVRRK